MAGQRTSLDAGVRDGELGAVGEVLQDTVVSDLGDYHGIVAVDLSVSLCCHSVCPEIGE